MASNSLESNFVSMKHSVEFLNIKDQYSCNEDFICEYQFNEYVPQDGDRLVIFKIGWTLVKDYVIFEWAPYNKKENILKIVFNKHIIPKRNFDEMYQICYLSVENELHGASSAFQFSEDKPKPVEPPLPNTLEKSVFLSLSENKQSTASQPNNTDEIKKLREENEMFKEALKMALLQGKKSCTNNYDSDISELKQTTGLLLTALNEIKQEVTVLKSKFSESKEEFKKLYMEKYKVEKKYEHLKTKVGKDKKLDNQVFDISDLVSIPPFPLEKPLK